MNLFFKRVVIAALSAATVFSFSSAVFATNIMYDDLGNGRYIYYMGGGLSDDDADRVIEISPNQIIKVIPNESESFYCANIRYIGNGLYVYLTPFCDDDAEELKKITVDLIDPAVMYKVLMESPANPQNGPLPTNEDEQARYDKDLKAFRESLIDTMRENFGIELGEAETKTLFSQGTALTKGDVNYDGKLNSKDIIALQRIILNPKKASDLQQYLADYNGDGRVNVKDVIAMMKAMIK